MKDLWSKISKGEGNMLNPSASTPPSSGDKDESFQEGRSLSVENSEFKIGPGPIEPEGKKSPGPRFLKFALFLILLIYALISIYHVPLLTFIGRFLVIDHKAGKADAIVCLAGSPVERGLAVAELFNKDLAPKIIVTRAPPPEGYAYLKARGIAYPESRDLLLKILRDLQVPDSAVIADGHIVTSTFSEAERVKKIIEDKGYGSVIIVTSPYHTRRAWLTFQEVLKENGVQIMMHASPYSGFSPGEWWKDRRYLKNVIIEYQKLLYYTFKHFL